jgi:hypothetical protein
MLPIGRTPIRKIRDDIEELPLSHAAFIRL